MADWTADGIKGTFQTVGQTEPDNTTDDTAVQRQPAKIQMQRAGLLRQAANDEERGEVLGEDGGQRHAVGGHMEADHKDQVQSDIQNTGCSQKIEGAFRITLRAEDRRAEIIDQAGGGTEEVDPDIERRHIDDVIGNSRESEQLRCKNEAEDPQHHAAQSRKTDRGVNTFSYRLHIVGAEGAGEDHVGTHGKAHEEVNKETDQIAAGADSSQSLRAGKTADHDCVGGVEQLLDQHGEAPQVDSCFRFIKNAEFVIFRQYCSDFKSLHFSA